jgi:hypothetical protein
MENELYMIKEELIGLLSTVDLLKKTENSDKEFLKASLPSA